MDPNDWKKGLWRGSVYAAFFALIALCRCVRPPRLCAFHAHPAFGGRMAEGCRLERRAASGAGDALALLHRGGGCLLRLGGVVDGMDALAR